jgi:quinol monooxygenase YgiN
MYGMINRFRAHPGQRDAAIKPMLQDQVPVEGCLSFVVALDPTDPDAFWLTEVWTTKEAWQASVALPQIKAGIDRMIPLIADWGTEVVTEPVGGIGISRKG